MIIMNPPFGSNVARSRKFPPDTVRHMQRNELAIRAELARMDKAAGNVIDSNSISTFFTPLADRLLDPERGTLAKVLPVTACVSASGLAERKFLASRFHVERIVTSHDPKHVNFSYKTSIHECLMVCRRHDGGDVKPPTEFVSLRRMPKNPKEAIEAADAIANGNAKDWGDRCVWPAARVEEGDWSPAQWYDAEMASAVYDLERSPLLEPLCAHHRVGPAGQAIRGSCEKCNHDDNGATLIFDSINTNLRRTIRGCPEAYCRPRHGKAKTGKKYLNMGSRLLVAARFRTTSSRLAAVCSDRPAVGSGWVPVSVGGKREAGALAVWWNSTPAMMMLLNRRSKTLDYPAWSIKHQSEIRIPKPDSTDWDALYETYVKVRDMEVRPLYEATSDPVRAMLDAAAANVLSVEPGVLAGWRRRLCREPTVSNKPYPL